MWRIAMPLILSMGALTIMQFTDRVFLARYSSISLQAALPAGILAHTMICLFQSIAGYSGTFAAQYHGAKKPGHCVHATIQGLWIALATWPIIIDSFRLASGSCPWADTHQRSLLLKNHTSLF
jgi:MATE family multidrug resistance protein